MTFVTFHPRFWLELKAIDDVTLGGNTSIRGCFVRFDDAITTSFVTTSSSYSKIMRALIQDYSQSIVEEVNKCYYKH